MLKGSYSMLERLKIYERLRPKHFSNTTQDIKAILRCTGVTVAEDCSDIFDRAH